MIVTFGEILLRLSTPQSLKITQTTHFDVQYGGSEANVAASLAHWGHTTAHITRLPNNDLGLSALQMLRTHGVMCDYIALEGARIGTYYLQNGAGHRGSKVIYDREHSAMAQISTGMVDWEKIFEKATWFHWSGITPAISAGAADVCLEALQAAQKAHVTISVDLNYRAKLWQYGAMPGKIMEKLLPYCDIIFGGIDAPEKYFGIVPQDKGTTRGELLETDLISIAEQLLSKFPKAKLFSTTLRWIKNNNHHQLQGMLFTRNNKELYLASVYDMPYMLDRVGGGDAYMAGLIHGLINFPNDYQKIADFATAASVLKHYIHGDVNTSTLSEIETTMQGQGMAISR